METTQCSRGVLWCTRSCLCTNMAYPVYNGPFTMNFSLGMDFLGDSWSEDEILVSDDDLLSLTTYLTKYLL